MLWLFCVTNWRLFFCLHWKPFLLSLKKLKCGSNVYSFSETSPPPKKGGEGREEY